MRRASNEYRGISFSERRKPIEGRCIMKKTTVAVLFSLLALAAWSNGTQETTSKPIVAVWYPNNSGEDWKAGRQALDDLVSKATGRPVTDKLTTDYVIAIEALATGNAAIAYPGAVGFLQAQAKNPHVKPLVVPSGDSGTLSDAFYNSRIVVRTENAPQYLKGSVYSLDNIKGKRFSFVSTSSTSGFVFPSNLIKSYFAKKEGFGDKKVEDLFLEGGTDKFFSQVVFGQSHQGSVLNVLTNKADAGAVDDIDVDSYFDLVSGAPSAPGTVYKVKVGAAAPFDTVPAGTSFTVIASVQVKNAPIAVNTDLFTPDQWKALQAAFLADSTTANPSIFLPAGQKGVSLFNQNGKNKFLPVDDAWYDPIRAMLK
jgi:phosphonate transport system substrate-binding protein